MGTRLAKYLKIHTGATPMAKVYFRVNHPIIPTVLFGALAATFIWLAQKQHPLSLWGILGGLLGGLFLWTLIEYALHRFVFHFTPKREPWRTLFSSLHLDHHRDTQDPGLIIAPPVVALSDSLIIFGILYLLTWNGPLALLLLAGIDLGYIFYEWVHYGVHQFNWNGGLWGYYKRYHFHHHFQKPAEGYGVTSPLWDLLLKTAEHR